MAALGPNVWGGTEAFLTALAVWAFVKRRYLQGRVGTGLTKKAKEKRHEEMGECQRWSPLGPGTNGRRLA